MEVLDAVRVAREDNEEDHSWPFLRKEKETARGGWRIAGPKKKGDVGSSAWRNNEILVAKNNPNRFHVLPILPLPVRIQASADAAYQTMTLKFQDRLQKSKLLEDF